MAALAEVAKWFEKVHREGQDYLKYHWGFNMAGNNEEKVEVMQPKGSVFPFMDNIIVPTYCNFLFKSLPCTDAQTQGKRIIKSRLFLHEGMQAFFADACFGWEDVPARRIKCDVLDKFPKLAPFCEPFNWKDHIPENVFMYLAASVSIV